MSDDFEGTPLSFEVVNELLFPDESARHFMGPQLPLSDPRICAGLLFVRMGDKSVRTLHDRSWEWPKILVRTLFDFSPSRDKSFLVTQDVVKKLLNAGVVQGTPRMGYTDMAELRLSSYGQRLVVSKWFCEEGMTISDALSAGAVFNPESGELGWQ